MCMSYVPGFFGRIFALGGLTLEEYQDTGILP